MSILYLIKSPFYNRFSLLYFDDSFPVQAQIQTCASTYVGFIKCLSLPIPLLNLTSIPCSGPIFPNFYQKVQPSLTKASIHVDRYWIDSFWECQNARR